ncbi:LuxR C-terminal-related transcriptional regulator [Jejubacter calystegiae]|nr:LuxR C-terminal-related transcriptional regulator [Jejubacter calystegiae]
MKVFVLSENFFFSFGLISILRRAGYDAYGLEPDDGLNTLWSFCSLPFIVIVDINERQRLGSMLNNILLDRTYLFFITDYDGAVLGSDYFDIFIPRKISCAGIVNRLNLYKPRRRYDCNLSEHEKIIIQLLVDGRSLYLISKQLNLSVKAVSRHKINALNKLGICRMNSKSLLFASEYIDRIRLLFSVYNNRVVSCIR